MSSSNKAHGFFAAAIAATCAVVTFCPSAFGQGAGYPEPVGGTSPERDQPRTETLVSGKVTHGGYGGPDVKMSAILGGPAVLVGGQGGWIIDHRFVLGAAGYGVATQHDVPPATQINGNASTLEMGYGGFRAMYVLWPERVVHLDVALLVGAGGLVVRTNDPVHTARGDRFQVGRDDVFFAMEPSLEMEVNVTRFMRVALSASYRYITGVEAPGLSYTDLSMPAGGLAFRFGKF